ncbi:MAG: hypothetical protein HUJ70_08685 [Pseudobutyrivibrio sp.]|nr:hypothetical protein [Pseudobutyrivibrio sp.]
MSYQGYLIKIGNNTVPVNIIVQGSYSQEITEPNIATWRNVDGVELRYRFPKKLNISFNLKQRTESEQLSVAFLFAQSGQTICTVYNPVTGDYQQKSFYISTEALTLASQDSTEIFYDETQIKFEEA